MAFTNEQIAQAIENGAKLIEERGWFGGTTPHHLLVTDRVCALLGIAWAPWHYTKELENSDLTDAACQAIVDHLRLRPVHDGWDDQPCSRVVQWNNAPTSTKRIVLDGMRSTAEALREKE